MNVSIEVALYIAYALLVIDLAIVGILLYRKWRFPKEQKKGERMTRFILNEFPELKRGEEPAFLRKNRGLFFSQFMALCQTISLSDSLKSKINQYLTQVKIVRYFVRKLHSRSRFQRIRAAVALGSLSKEISEEPLNQALFNEKNRVVKLYIANALVDIQSTRAIPLLIHSLVGAPQWYQTKLQVLISEFDRHFYEYSQSLRDTETEEIQQLLIYFASHYLTEDLREYLKQKAGAANTAIAYSAIRALAKSYFHELSHPKYLQHKDPTICHIAITSLANIPSRESLEKLLPFLKDPLSEVFAASSISAIVRVEPIFISLLLERFKNETEVPAKQALAKILSERVEYLILKLLTPEKEAIKALIKEILLLKKTNAIIGFLNKNKNIEIENEIVSILKEVISLDENLDKEFCTYLDERIIKKLDRLRCEEILAQKDEKKERSKIVTLYFYLILIVLLFPLLHLIRHYDQIPALPFVEHLKIYVLDFNYYLAYYSIAINLIYLVLLFLGYLGGNRQLRYWEIKQRPFLFKKRMLPSISIIAPAYGEEATIIESANSLLNLKYPNYELIIVNDGSKDNTLQRLITYFNLEKIDPVFDLKLKTKPIRGLYKNKMIPKLTVVDKSNGGKADSLNAGINISAKDYFCAIDADSLLETDALLKIASMSMDHETEIVASGGNILPINGCKVDKGAITDVHIPRQNLARFQMIEYLRAFMAGRIGWSSLNSLLIISGAFGLFNKERIISIGGYLTSSERYQKDTVGEDMELVVRLSRQLHENHHPHKICHIFNANCWTEVPENFKILYKQRDRWQRGLIDILTFHKKIILNPKYGKMGLVALPYFFVFEMLGPIIEIQGYLMVILAAIFGMLNVQIALFLFISSIMLGTLISMSSLLIAEKEIAQISIKETVLLGGYALIENFGFRQIVSFWRVMGYFNSLKKPAGWGKMVRKGFATENK